MHATRSIRLLVALALLLLGPAIAAAADFNFTTVAQAGDLITETRRTTITAELETVREGAFGETTKATVDYELGFEHELQLRVIDIVGDDSGEGVPGQAYFVCSKDESTRRLPRHGIETTTGDRTGRSLFVDFVQGRWLSGSGATLPHLQPSFGARLWGSGAQDRGATWPIDPDVCKALFSADGLFTSVTGTAKLVRIEGTRMTLKFDLKLSGRDAVTGATLEAASVAGDVFYNTREQRITSLDLKGDVAISISTGSSLVDPTVASPPALKVEGTGTVRFNWTVDLEHGEVPPDLVPTGPTVDPNDPDAGETTERAPRVVNGRYLLEEFFEPNKARSITITATAEFAGTADGERYDDKRTLDIHFRDVPLNVRDGALRGFNREIVRMRETRTGRHEPGGRYHFSSTAEGETLAMSARGAEVSIEASPRSIDDAERPWLQSLSCVQLEFPRSRVEPGDTWSSKNGLFLVTPPKTRVKSVKSDWEFVRVRQDGAGTAQLQAAITYTITGDGPWAGDYTLSAVFMFDYNAGRFASGLVKGRAELDGKVGGKQLEGRLNVEYTITG